VPVVDRHAWFVGGLSAAGALAIGAALAASGGSATTHAAAEVARPTHAVVLPASFERNLGQADPRVRFVAREPGATVFLTPSSAVIALSGTGPRGARAIRGVLEMSLAEANAKPRISARGQLPGRANYMIGPRATWRAGVAGYRQVTYTSVYPGMDLRYHSAHGQLEYEFALRSGADPGRIAIVMRGATRQRIDHAGNLWLTVGGHTIEQPRPAIYQVLGAARRAVGGGFRLLGHDRVGFTLAAYDRARPLVIDPTIVYSTPLVGSAPGSGLGVAVDRSGDTYVTGDTTSANFPTEDPLQARPKGPNVTAFVAKLDPTGALVYATYLGGSRYTEGRGVAVDGAGEAYVTGATNSTDFPTTRSAFQPSYGGGPFDAFVAKLDASGTGLVYSTFLGDTHYDEGNAIAVDAHGRAVVTGKTASPNFPLADPLAPHSGSGAFVTKLDRAGGRLVSSSVFGGNSPGNDADDGYGIAVDARGDTYVTGETNDPGFPTVKPLQPALAGGGNAFVIKIDAASRSLVYATYLGGSGNDIGRAIAADGDGNAYVTGQTTSRNFPTANAIEATNASPGPVGADAFVAKLDPAGDALVYSTYLGGSGDDGAYGIGVDRSQNAFVDGQTASPDFPLASPLQRTLHGPTDAFVGELDRSGAFIRYSTLFGGSSADAALALALDRTGAVQITGQTDSSDFPRRGVGHRGPKRYATPGDGAFVTVVRFAARRSRRSGLTRQPSP
jgi:hypothetical protein